MADASSPPNSIPIRWFARVCTAGASAAGTSAPQANFLSRGFLSLEEAKKWSEGVVRSKQYKLISLVVFGGDLEQAHCLVGVTPEGTYLWKP